MDQTIPTPQIGQPKTSLLEKISKGAIIAAVFLIPIFFLPWTANVLDFNKQALLIVLVFVSLFALLLKSLIKGSFSFNPTSFNIPVIILFLIMVFSTVFSMWRYGSFWGWPLDATNGLLTLLCLVLFYFLVVNIFQKKEEIFFLLLSLVSGGFLAALFGELQIFSKFIFPLAFTKSSSFNTIGTVNSFGIFLAALLPIIIALIFVLKGNLKYVLGAMGVTVFFGIFLVNFWAVWIALLVGMAGVLVFAITRARQIDTRWLILPMLVLVVSLLFGLFRIPISGLPANNLEVGPSARATLDISSQVLKERPLLGSGPGTFLYDFSQYKSLDLNQTLFWNIRFARGFSDIFEGLGTLGILGVISILFFIGSLIYFGVKYLGPRAQTEIDFSWTLALGIFGSFLAVVTGKFLYPSSLAVDFLFWLFASVFIVLISQNIKTWKLEPSSPVTIGLSFVFVLVLIFGIGLFYLEGQRYSDEVRYAFGLTALNQGNTQKALDSISKAALPNSPQENYWRDLSQAYLIRINEILAQKDLTQDQKSQLVTTLVGNTINAAKIATDVNSNNVANWSNRGFVYRNLIGIVGGVDEWAVTSYETAEKLEPTNPFLPTELGRVYLVMADLLSQQTGKAQEMALDLQKARESFEKAISLKSDYAPAHFQIAMIDVREGKTREAIDKLEATKLVAAPRDTGLAFQLGLLYYNDSQFDKAKAEFENAVSWNENYSNARYFLGLVYDRQGQKTKAIEQFEKIVSLNPDNQDVAKILANLKAGKPALQGVISVQPATGAPEIPIQEKQPERK